MFQQFDCEGESIADVKLMLDFLKKYNGSNLFVDLNSIIRTFQSCSYTPGIIIFYIIISYSFKHVSGLRYKLIDKRYMGCYMSNVYIFFGNTILVLFWLFSFLNCHTWNNQRWMFIVFKCGPKTPLFRLSYLLCNMLLITVAINSIFEMRNCIVFASLCSVFSSVCFHLVVFERSYVFMVGFLFLGFIDIYNEDKDCIGRHASCLLKVILSMW